MEKVFEKIPDVWFDIYARLIPGFIFVLALKVSVFSDPTVPAWDQLLFLLILGYALGHIIQPIASVLSRTLEFRVFDREKNIDKCKKHFAADSRQARLLSKQHAECTCFTSLLVFTILLITMFRISDYQGLSPYQPKIELLAILYFSVCSLLRAHAVASRAKKYIKAVN